MPARSTVWMTVLCVSLACAAAVFAGSKTQAAEVPLKTKIVSAVVYNGQAQVTRAGTVRLEAGTARIVCDDLPVTFSAISLQVAGRGTAGATILGTDVIVLQQDPSESPRFKELKARLAVLEASRDSVDIQVNALRARQKFVEELAAFPMKEGNEKLAPEIFRVDDWKSLMDFMQVERTRSDTKLRALTKQREEIQNEIAWINREISGMSRSERGIRVAIDCAAKSAGDLTLELTYLVPGTSWNPEYIVRYDPAGGSIDLTYNARLGQRTGEDWSGIDVTLSTAMPHVGAAPPELKPWYLGQRVPRAPEMGRVLKTQEIVVEAADAAHVMGGRDKEAEFETAEVASSAFAASFHLPTPVDLPSGADPKRVRILQGGLAGDLSRYTAPRLKQNVFVRAETTNSLGAPILPGAAEVYIESPAPGGGTTSTFVGRQSIPAVAEEGTFDLSLGVDQDLKVAHKLEKREYVEKEGKKQTKIRYYYLITLENFKKEAAEVVLQDRIPVPVVKEIEVDDVDIEPKPDERRDDGILTWNLSPAPGEKIEIRLAYTIVFPGDWPEAMLNLE